MSPKRKTRRFHAGRRKPEGGLGHAPSGLNTARNLALLELIDPARTLVEYGKALERARDTQAALVLVIVGVECGQAGSCKRRIWSEAGRARLVQMQIHEFGADIEALSGVQRLVPIRVSLRFETPTAPPKPASALAG